MRKAALVVGARPQFIKTAPLIMEMGRFFKTVLIHTGQHYDFSMSEGFFRELNLQDPDYHLETSGKTQGRQTGRMMEDLESVFGFEKPDFVIVIGDTNSTLAGALAASKLGMPLVHVEAGVRSKDRRLPEQINRVVTDSISDCFLCPTPSAVKNLNNEGKKENVFDAGDIIYDCLRFFENRIPSTPSLSYKLPERYVLATIHRSEAVDNREHFEAILRSLGTSPYPVIYPIHPRSRKMIDMFDLGDSITENLLLIDPVGYIDLLSVIRVSEFVVTDSGGVQREAVFMKKPVYVARPETEWLELEQGRWVHVVGYDFDLSASFNTKRKDFEELKRLTRPSSENMVEIMNSLY